jgi:hypothetical protein
MTACVAGGCQSRPQAANKPEQAASSPRVIAPPEPFFQKIRESDRDAARQFYRKYIDVKGMPVTASAEVDDRALQRTYYVVTHLLAGRPDILQAMITNGTRLIIIGKNQVYTDMPEYRRARDPEYLNERVRGTGGFDVTSFGEENLLCLPIDRYDDDGDHRCSSQMLFTKVTSSAAPAPTRRRRIVVPWGLTNSMLHSNA